MLDAFYVECRAYVRVLARRWFGAGDAEDIAQEVMLRLVRSLPSLDLERPIEPWLATVTRNVGVSMLRARREVASDEVDASLEPAPDLPGLAVEQTERVGFLRAALHRLSPSDAELLVLHEVQEVPISALARRHGVAPNAIRQRLFRARRRLGTAYAELGGPRSILWPPMIRAVWRRLSRSTAPCAGTAGPVAVVAMSALLVAGGGVLAIGAMEGRVVDVRTEARTVGSGMPARRPDRPVGYAFPSRSAAAGMHAKYGARQPAAVPSDPSPEPIQVETENQNLNQPFKRGERFYYRISVVVLGHRVLTVSSWGQNPEEYGPVCSTAVIVCEPEDPRR